ncbi:unnamed protein product [Phytophthora lilii]|uniref:Unnamed protein product n=1 Tax=Phytophthora lilii TaxID=2077276 RepID=A0A9W6XA48_9STRA|nr:unnamed protein product [Phytophthora lilii]
MTFDRRIDDMMKPKFENVTANIQHPSTAVLDALANNISEERDAPEQVMLGCLDPRMCALLNFAVYMDVM